LLNSSVTALAIQLIQANVSCRNGWL